MAKELEGHYLQLVQGKYSKVHRHEPKLQCLVDLIILQFLVSKLIRYWFVHDFPPGLPY